MADRNLYSIAQRGVGAARTAADWAGVETSDIRDLTQHYSRQSRLVGMMAGQQKAYNEQLARGTLAAKQAAQAAEELSERKRQLKDVSEKLSRITNKESREYADLTRRQEELNKTVNLTRHALGEHNRVLRESSEWVGKYEKYTAAATRSNVLFGTGAAILSKSLTLVKSSTQQSADMLLRYSDTLEGMNANSRKAVKLGFDMTERHVKMEQSLVRLGYSTEEANAAFSSLFSTMRTSGAGFSKAERGAHSYAVELGEISNLLGVDLPTSTAEAAKRQLQFGRTVGSTVKDMKELYRLTTSYNVSQKRSVVDSRLITAAILEMSAAQKGYGMNIRRTQEYMIALTGAAMKRGATPAQGVSAARHMTGMITGEVQPEHITHEVGQDMWGEYRKRLAGKTGEERAAEVKRIKDELSQGMPKHMQERIGKRFDMLDELEQANPGQWGMQMQSVTEFKHTTPYMLKTIEKIKKFGSFASESLRVLRDVFQVPDAMIPDIAMMIHRGDLDNVQRKLAAIRLGKTELDTGAMDGLAHVRKRGIVGKIVKDVTSHAQEFFEGTLIGGALGDFANGDVLSGVGKVALPVAGGFLAAHGAGLVANKTLRAGASRYLTSGGKAYNAAKWVSKWMLPGATLGAGAGAGAANAAGLTFTTPTGFPQELLGAGESSVSSGASAAGRAGGSAARSLVGSAVSGIGKVLSKSLLPVAIVSGIADLLPTNVKAEKADSFKAADWYLDKVEERRKDLSTMTDVLDSLGLTDEQKSELGVGVKAQQARLASKEAVVREYKRLRDTPGLGLSGIKNLPGDVSHPELLRQLRAGEITQERLNELSGTGDGGWMSPRVAQALHLGPDADWRKKLQMAFAEEGGWTPEGYKRVAEGRMQNMTDAQKERFRSEVLANPSDEVIAAMVKANEVDNSDVSDEDKVLRDYFSKDFPEVISRVFTPPLEKMAEAVTASAVSQSGGNPMFGSIINRSMLAYQQQAGAVVTGSTSGTLMTIDGRPAKYIIEIKPDTSVGGDVSAVKTVR